MPFQLQGLLQLGNGVRGTLLLAALPSNVLVLHCQDKIPALSLQGWIFCQKNEKVICILLGSS